MTSLFDNYFLLFLCLTVAIYYHNLSKNLIEYKYNVLKISVLDVWKGIKYTLIL